MARQARSLSQQVERYLQLNRMLFSYRKVNILDFNSRAAEEFEQLRKQRIRIGSMDLKIAAIALASDATLLSRNIRDFGKVPGLKVEDWSA
ncbi:MAG: type II toxin-antitoxin system VapC family toxin [Acidobacteriota bacterium]